MPIDAERIHTLTRPDAQFWCIFIMWRRAGIAWPGTWTTTIQKHRYIICPSVVNVIPQFRILEMTERNGRAPGVHTITARTQTMIGTNPRLESTYLISNTELASPWAKKIIIEFTAVIQYRLGRTPPLLLVANSKTAPLILNARIEDKTPLFQIGMTTDSTMRIKNPSECPQGTEKRDLQRPLPGP